jgi:hypothetical protein
LRRPAACPTLGQDIDRPKMAWSPRERQCFHSVDRHGTAGSNRRRAPVALPESAAHENLHRECWERPRPDLHAGAAD